MFYIGIENKVNSKHILDFFNDLFPQLNIEIYEDFYTYEDPIPDIVINYYDNGSEFTVVLDVSILHKTIDENTLCHIYTELSRLISNKFNCRTICEGTRYGENAKYPGYSLIWDNNQSYLADDYGSDFFDEGGGRVKIRKEISIDLEIQRFVLKKALI